MKRIKMTEEAIKNTLAAVEAELRGAKMTRNQSIQLANGLTEEEKKTYGKAEVHICKTAYDKMQALISECSKEIAWHGTIERDEEKPYVFWITDILVFPQTVTGATVTCDDTEYALWLYSDEVGDNFDKLRFHGHSHVNMGVTPSGTDETYRENLMQNVNDFYVFGIFNKRDDYNLIIYDVENNIMFENSDIDYYIPLDESGVWAKEQMEAKVKEQTFTTPKSSVNSGTSSHMSSNSYVPSSKGGRRYDAKTKTWVYDDDEDDAGEAWWSRHYGYGYGYGDY